jgi:hypothetical protein
MGIQKLPSSHIASRKIQKDVCTSIDAKKALLEPGQKPNPRIAAPPSLEKFNS